MLLSDEVRQRLLHKFRTETSQNLATLRLNLPFLNEPEDRDAIITMFFAAHTIKGNLGMMQILEVDLSALNDRATDLETTLLGLRNRELMPGPVVARQLEEYLSQLESQFSLSLSQETSAL